MSKFMLGNVFLLLSMLLASTSQILIKELMEAAQPIDLSWKWLRVFSTRSGLLRATIIGVMIGSGFLCWLYCLTKLNLSYAYPIACSSVLLVTFFSIVFLGETVTPRMWAGSALIVLGIILLVPPE